MENAASRRESSTDQGWTKCYLAMFRFGQQQQQKCCFCPQITGDHNNEVTSYFLTIVFLSMPARKWSHCEAPSPTRSRPTLLFTTLRQQRSLPSMKTPQRWILLSISTSAWVRQTALFRHPICRFDPHPQTVILCLGAAGSFRELLRSVQKRMSQFWIPIHF